MTAHGERGRVIIRRWLDPHVPLSSPSPSVSVSFSALSKGDRQRIQLPHYDRFHKSLPRGSRKWGRDSRGETEGVVEEEVR